MARLMTYDEYLTRLSERVVDNTRQLKRGVHQRRNGMEDLYGVEFTHNGDATHPATFYISISPDLVYYERFDFKFIIGAYESAVAGIDLSGEGMTVSPTSLSVSGDGGTEIITGTSTLKDDDAKSITPNPHTHSLSGGSMSGSVSYGINQISTSSANWRVEIHGVDITDYLIEQHDGAWIAGQGIYPTNKVETKEDFYDILDVASMMMSEGTDESIANVRKLLRPEFKKVQIFSDAPFSVTAFLYLKYSHLNR